MPTDTELLDYLDGLEVADKWLDDRHAPGWQLRLSSTGRGFRLLTTSRKPNYQTARAAIAAALADGPVDPRS